MLDGRRDRQPVATVSFIGAKSNRAVDHEGREPSLEAVLRAMHSAGFEGDLYPPPSAWETSAVGADERTHERSCNQRIANWHRLIRLRQTRAKIIDHRFMDQQATRRSATLSRSTHRAKHDCARDEIHVCIIHHDDCVVAAEFEQRAAESLRNH